jgi:hypothetical protein
LATRDPKTLNQEGGEGRGNSPPLSANMNP